MSRVEQKANQKGKRSKKDIAYYIIMLVLLCVMLFSGIKVYTIAREYKKGTDVYDNIAEDVGATPERADIEQAQLSTRLELDWDKLEDKNPDIQAWIRCMGTLINYPVVQGNDNSYYLSHLPDGTWNNKGTIFIDARCEKPFKSFLTIVYGHRMNDKSMFHVLGEYFEQSEEPFFLEHPVMELYTRDRDYDIQIFGAAVISTTDEFLYNNYLYNENEIQKYIDWIFANNQLVGYDNRVSVTPSDRIVMMSTCTLSATDDNRRVIVWGKLVEADRDLAGDESN